MEKTKSSKKKILESKRAIQIISLLIAIAGWFFVIFFVSPEKNKTLSDISVKLNSNYTVMERLELEAIEGLEQKVEVKISGNRSVVDTVTASDFTIYAQVGEVTGAGEYELSLIGEKNSNKDFDIQSISPASIKVKFDRFVSKTFAVNVDIDGLEGENGYLVEDYTVSPIEVILTGPETEINSIARCAVKLSVTTPLNSTANFRRQEIKLFDENGAEISREHISFDNSEANVTIPVLKIKSLPIKIGFINLPANFREEDLRYEFSNDEIMIAGPASVVDNYTALQVGYVDIKTLTPSSNYVFGIELPTGFVNMENIEQITVAFGMEDYISKSVSVSDIRIVNQPTNYDISVISKKISGVTLYGTAETLDATAASDIIAEIDMGGGVLKLGQYKVPVNITIPSQENVWAVGDYTVIVKVSEAE